MASAKLMSLCLSRSPDSYSSMKTEQRTRLLFHESLFLDAAQSDEAAAAAAGPDW